MRVKVKDLNAEHIGMYICNLGEWRQIAGLNIRDHYTEIFHQYETRGLALNHAQTTCDDDMYVHLKPAKRAIEFSPDELQMLDNALYLLSKQGNHPDVRLTKLVNKLNGDS